jgi:hypothetical protein
MSSFVRVVLCYNTGKGGEEMEKADQIISMLEKVLTKQDEHSEILEEHGKILDEHSRILNKHSKILDEHSKILGEHSEILDEHTRILGKHGEILNSHSAMHKKHEQQFENHSAQLKEHSQLLHALIAGQESLKAELDGFKVETRNEFKELKAGFNTFTVNQKLLREESWLARVDIEKRTKAQAPV